MEDFLHKEICYQILGAIFAARTLYGAHQKEIVYQNALEEELIERNLRYQREVGILILSPKTGKKMGSHRLDFVVDSKIIIEIKALTYVPEKLENQLYAYLRSTPFEVGYLVNFASSKLYYKRIILTNDRKILC